jgi:hypothetical protein
MFRRSLRRHRWITALASIAVVCGAAVALATNVTSGSAQSQPAKIGPSRPVGEPVNQGAPPLNPCTLVTVSEAAGIDQAIARADEAPIGPTCIYEHGKPKAKGHGNSKRTITLTVGPMKFSQLAAQITNGQPVTIGKHTGKCGHLGADTLVLPLSDDRVLSISAPCAHAKRFAEIALKHLGE